MLKGGVGLIIAEMLKRIEAARIGRGDVSDQDVATRDKDWWTSRGPQESGAKNSARRIRPGGGFCFAEFS